MKITFKILLTFFILISSSVSWGQTATECEASDGHQGAANFHIFRNNQRGYIKLS